MLDLGEVTQARLDDPETGWNMGRFGASAESHHVAGDPPATGTGAQRRFQAVALCLPEDKAAGHGRDRLTELGPDAAAIRPEDRSAVLFDMGLAQPRVDFCIRTANPALLAVLRAAEGRSLFERDNPALCAILSAHPHRVALTRLGRVEVLGKIGGPDTGRVPPEPPHTHVLPKHLQAGRTLAANAPVPEGWTPRAALHPGDPVSDRMGQHTGFNPVAFCAIQDLLSAWGPPEYVAEKTAVRAEPDTIDAPDSPPGRTGLRNAIRPWRHQAGDSALAAGWSERFDLSGTSLQTEAPGH